ncbi:hypothetical protein [Streptomyces cyaneofuscatus]|uniref:hypothetical protein n=1 Tax=Streptomyces cyaneofuscatus TaxID=66883 RepID=UPI00331DF6C2
MFVFVCAGCGAGLTAPLSQVALPVHAHQVYGNGARLPVLMEPGTFAVDPEPGGPPRRREEAHDGAPGAIVIAPGDTRGTLLIPEKGGGHCCGVDGSDGPNMACQACGLPVASRIDDCSLWQAVWLAPDAVRRRRVGGADAVPLSWAELMAEEKGTPPFEPVARWGSPAEVNAPWPWSPRWEAAAGQALAHLLVASQGRPVTVPGGLTEEVFRRALDTLLPSGPPPRRAVLAGPGRPAPDADADILLVPLHPQTGEPWTPTGPAASACRVPLPFGVWLRLASPEPHPPVPASGVLPEGVLRDDPPVPRSPRLFRADPGVFRHTLVRLPAARSPWFREILENIPQHVRAGLF